jgi:prepilin-type N-terminal cleavage/methylation domain-containing protein
VEKILMNIHRKEKGFTIIEVVLVLAIAGLIFMMVFIALPALQRSQRDTQRKNDLSRAITAVTNYTSANRGSLPTNWNGTFVSQYLTTGGDSFIDPSGLNTTQDSALATYFFSSNSGDLSDSFNAKDTQNVVYYAVGYTCATGGAVTEGGTRKVALRIYLEGGGVYCVNN